MCRWTSGCNMHSRLSIQAQVISETPIQTLDRNASSYVRHQLPVRHFC